MDTSIPTVTLSSSVPKIKIIEPSPMSTTSTTVLPKAQEPESLNDGSDPSDLPHSSKDAVVQGQSSTSVLVESDDEYKPASDCKADENGTNECKFPMPPVVDIVPVTDVSSETNLQMPLNEEDNLKEHNCHWSGNRFFRKWHNLSSAPPSRFGVFILLPMMVFPIGLCGVALNHVNECPMSEGITALVFTIGLDVLVILLFRIFNILQKIRHPNENPYITTCCIVCGCFILLIILCFEMQIFFSSTPSFESAKPNYCHPVFYKVTFIMNCAIPVIFMLAFFVYLPRFLVTVCQTNIS